LQINAETLKEKIPLVNMLANIIVCKESFKNLQWFYIHLYLKLCTNVIIFFVVIPVPSKSSRALHKTGMTGASGKDYAAEENKTEEAVDERNAHTR
jgi:hypothetical protein